ncbi:hypothetical protein GWN26_06320 [Candidatus Saccharibacteria bacterium]|nr:hypothetical protein [Candidatus Saccharibacteria bacterium]NIV72305.1 hypothetical protein [Calditrichia bacterium]NIV98771.1 hypothetical protein [Candidatus Saccharibacteria bacterium]NIW79595.1 hypothetical protein [Calditrichia bacterium]
MRKSAGPFTILLLLVGIAACIENGSKVSGHDDSNILFQESFEKDDQPTHESWNVALASFNEDTPEDGGGWALELKPGWVPQEGFAERCVNGETGPGIYRLTACVKNIHNGKGSLMLGYCSGTEYIKKKVATFNVEGWTTMSVTDSLYLQPGDQIWIKLSAGTTEVVTWKILFDEVKLEKIE